MLKKKNFTNNDLTSTAMKMKFKHRSGMDITKDAALYISELLSKIPEQDKYSRLHFMAENYIKKHISNISDIPIARLQQYLSLLNAIKDEDILNKDMWINMNYISAEMNNCVQEISPNVSIMPDSSFDEEYISVDDYITKYRNKLKEITDYDIGSNEWLKGIIEMAGICFDSCYLDFL